MAKFKAKVLVTYIIEAENVDEAMQIVEFNTEYPVIPYEAGHYVTDELVSIYREVTNGVA
jgi:hypothetical protein